MWSPRQVTHLPHYLCGEEGNGSEIHRQSGVNELAKVSKLRQCDSYNIIQFTWTSHSLHTFLARHLSSNHSVLCVCRVPLEDKHDSAFITELFICAYQPQCNKSLFKNKCKIFSSKIAIIITHYILQHRRNLSIWARLPNLLIDYQDSASHSYPSFPGVMPA